MALHNWFVKYGSFLVLVTLSFNEVPTVYSSSHGQHDDHDLHKDHVAFLGEEAAAEFEGLTPKESLRRLRMLVPKMDANKDGFVDENELTIWVRHKLQKLTENEDIEAIFHDLDFDFNGQVSWDEYMMRTFGFFEKDKNDKRYQRQHLFVYIEDDRLKWKFADKNNDSFLNREEYEFFHHPREHEAMSTYIAVIEMNEHDKDKDGFLSLNEFLACINDPAFVHLDTKQFHQTFDLNHDGKLDLYEVELWKKPKNYDIAEGQAQHLIESSDENQDGKLTIDEISRNHHVFVGSLGTRYGQVLHDEF